MDPVFIPAMQAIYASEFEELREILDADPDLVTRHSSCGHPTLLQFVAVDHRKIADAPTAASMLLDRGASAQQALLAAASTASRDVMALLLQQGADLSVGPWQPLDEALYWSHTDFAHELRELGAPLRALSSAAGLGELESLKLFFEDDVLLGAAGPIGSPFDVDPALSSLPQQILDHALITAMLNEQVDAMTWLLEAGAQINSKPTGFHWGGTALHAAVWRGDASLVTWALEHGADPSIRDDSYDADALGWANHNSHSHIVALLEHRAPR